jgi:hypothetical protein
MRYELTPINTRPWLLNGLSLRLIESHYENHYGGALRRLNANCRGSSRSWCSALTDFTWDARRPSRSARLDLTRST